MNQKNPFAPDWLELPKNVNALSQKVWPTSLARTDEGEITVGGVPVSALADEYGTPLYLYDTAMVRARAEEIRTVFQEELARVGADAQLYYAGKAFLSSDVVTWMLEAGLNIDVSTGGELALALAAGAPGKRLGLHGNNKSDAELEHAVHSQVGTIVIDYPGEIDRIATIAAAAGRTQAVRLRVRTGVHAHTHSFLATAHDDQKFGVSLAEVAELVAAIRSHESLEFRGLHAHIGSQIFGADGFTASLTVLLEQHAALLVDGPVPELNIGGGFGIAYTEADDPISIRDIATAIADGLAETANKIGLKKLPLIALEPGRWIIGPAGITLYRTGASKDVQLVTASGEHAVRRYISVDGGMSDNARPALYEAQYHVRLANRVSAADPVLIRLAGKHCESGDIVVYDDYLPSDIERDDLVVVAATGAYCWSMASNYNFLHRPAVVGVEDGISRVMVYRETVAELLARDAGLDRMNRTVAFSEGTVL